MNVALRSLPQPRRGLPARPATPRDTPVTLGFLCPHDSTDRRTFSGTPFFAAAALAARPGLSLRRIGASAPPRGFARLWRSAPSGPPPEAFAGLDAVVGLVATRLVPTLPGHLPYLHVTDATPAFLRAFYGRRGPRGADAAERAAALRADCLVYSSAAMAGRAGEDLCLGGLSPAVLPFGINFDRLPDLAPKKPALAAPRLLFVGRDWHRKGGDTALDILERLRADGLRASLTVVGPVPRGIAPRPGLSCVGTLDKNRPDEAAALSRLYGEAHLLLLPTRGDCTPMVMAEAMAHGTPVMVTDTGGTAEILGRGGAGVVLPREASAAEWAGEIRDLLGRPVAHAMMSDAAFDRARHKLTWDAWAKGIEGLVRQSLSQRRRIAV